MKVIIYLDLVVNYINNRSISIDFYSYLLYTLNRTNEDQEE